jgi:hypothetical protein
MTNTAPQELLQKSEIPLAAGSVVTCDADQTCVLVSTGRVVAALGPGSHTLDAQQAPAGVAAYIVKTSPPPELTMGGELGMFADPDTALPLHPRIHARFTVQVAQPVPFVLAYCGLGSDVAAMFKSFTSNAFGTTKRRLETLLRRKELSPVNLRYDAVAPHLPAIVADIDGVMSAYGVRVLEITEWVAALPPEDEQRRAQRLQELAQPVPPAVSAPAGLAASPTSVSVKFCPNCGQRLGCPSCGAPVQGNFCSSCGQRLG